MMEFFTCLQHWKSLSADKCKAVDLHNAYSLLVLCDTPSSLTPYSCLSLGTACIRILGRIALDWQDGHSCYLDFNSSSDKRFLFAGICLQT